MSLPSHLHFEDLVNPRLIASRIEYWKTKLPHDQYIKKEIIIPFLGVIIHDEYEFLHQCFQLANSPSITPLRTAKRKLSEYILFCQHMKKHYPTYTNLQQIWANIGHASWIHLFPGTITAATEEIKQHAETQTDLQRHKRKYEKVMYQFMLVSEQDDYLRTLMNLRMELRREEVTNVVKDVASFL